MSGAGRSVAADQLEDLGWFVIDNLPAILVPKVSELAHSNLGGYERVALVMGSSDSGAEFQVEKLRQELGNLTVVYLEASNDTILRRYKTTKRRHPHALEQSVAEAIEHERSFLAPTRAAADIVIDTSDLNPYELGDRLKEYFSDDLEEGTMQITLTSFGFKHGLPLDIDMMFDCRFMPNPYWDEKLRRLNGTNLQVQEYVLTPQLSTEFVKDVADLLEKLLPAYRAEGKSYLTVGFGCTGGHHRSVTVVETVARLLEQRAWPARISHRDIER